MDAHDDQSDRTLSRRELRALRNASAPVVDDEPVIRDALIETPLPLVAPRPDPSAEVEAAMAEFDALYLHRSLPEETPDQLMEVAPEVVAPQETFPAEILQDKTPAVEDGDLLHTLVEPTAPAPTGPAALIPPPPAAQPIEDAPIREVVTAPEVYTRPIGHWSTQAGIDDENQIADHTLSRDLAASDAITTSALVLPNFPQSGPFTGPVSSTGEILITGSIDLPRSLGMSGRYPTRYDGSDIDAIIDGTDREDAAPDSAPVRAIRAVSTHTSSQGIIATKRPKGNNLPVILSITAGVLAVSVVVLFVAGMIFKIF